MSIYEENNTAECELLGYSIYNGSLSVFMVHVEVGVDFRSLVKQTADIGYEALSTGWTMTGQELAISGRWLVGLVFLVRP